MDFLAAFLELALVYPGMLLAYLPMGGHLRYTARKTLLLTGGLVTLLCVLGAVCCAAFQLRTLPVLVVMNVVIGVFYIRSLTISRLKSFNVLLAVWAVFACLIGVARSINSHLYPGHISLWFHPCVGAVYLGMCFAAVGIAWYPATHAVVDLLQEERIAQTWYVFWLLPLVFILLNLFMLSSYPDALHDAWLMRGYIILSLVLLAILGIFYALFCLLARSLERNDRLEQENQFLSMQQAQYNSLQMAIEETRHVRHDMRHHIRTLSALVKRQAWSEVERYLDQVQEDIPSTELIMCANQAVDSVAGHYRAMFQKHQIPFTARLDCPELLPVSEINLCIVLSNLLENAMEASQRMEKESRHVRLTVQAHGAHMVLVSVENAFDGDLREKNGVFQSSKRRGSGIGTQSVRRIAEKTGGYCRFTHQNGIFCADVMLRSV